ncbi:MAG: sensor histidine kinase [Armatimonadetes bacterium]|nr:sensor histidine kinase [Armatimonadota bacterium]MDW8123022.1 sensor histidine kinase [Armatimonadota bacterium]
MTEVPKVSPVPESLGVSDLGNLPLIARALSGLGRGLVRLLAPSEKGFVIVSAFYQGQSQESQIGRVLEERDEFFAAQALKRKGIVLAPCPLTSEAGLVDHFAVCLGPFHRLILTVDLPVQDVHYSLRDLFFPARLVEQIGVSLWGPVPLKGLLPRILRSRKGIVIWDRTGRVVWGNFSNGSKANLPLGAHQDDEGFWLVTPAGIIFSEKQRTPPSLVGFALIRSEIHHRMKNDLQSVIGTLRLQARRAPSEDARKALNDAAERVRAFAFVHDLLARVRGDAVALRPLIQQLLDIALQQGRDEGKNLEGAVIGPDLFLSPRQASSLASALHELIRNAVEHAFSTGFDGQITVFIERQTDRLTVRVQDNGVGFPSGSLPRHRLGLTIVRNLVEQDLKGRFSIERGPENGTVATLQFPLDSRYPPI